MSPGGEPAELERLSGWIHDANPEQLGILRWRVAQAESAGHFSHNFAQGLLDQIHDAEVGERKPEWEA